MLSIKIHGGTPQLGKGLCHTCKHARIVRGQNCEERIVCTGGLFETSYGGDGVVQFRVAECSRYHPINMPWLHEMEEIAWTVEARRRGDAGFQRQKDEGEMVVTIKPPTGDEGRDDPVQSPLGSGNW